MNDARDPLPPAHKMANELIYARFHALVNELGVKQSTISQETGVRESAISEGMNKQTGLDMHWPVIMTYFAKVHRINPDWFLRNTEPRFLSDSGAAPTPSVHGNPTVNPPSGSIRVNPPSLREIGVVNGQNRFVRYDHEKYRVCAAQGILQVQSDDMSPVIRTGQWVILAEQSRKPHNGDIVVCETSQDTWVRRINAAPGDKEIFLLEASSHSPHVRTIIVKRTDVVKITVVTGVLFE